MPCTRCATPASGESGSRLDVGEKSCRLRPHRRQFAPRVAAGPQAKVGRQALRRVLRAERRLAGSLERFRRFRRAEASRGDERVAVGHLQLRHAMALRGLRLNLVGFRQRGQQRLRLGDLRHFGRRRKAFERRREHGVGVGGTAGRLIELGQ